MEELQILRSLNLKLSWLPGFEVVVQCAGMLDELLGNFALDLGMNTPTHMYRDQILGMDPP